jgi:threonine/homoserine/homoserine lactone efflux protein
MSFSFVMAGMMVGFSIAAPVGPIGVLCIRRTLAEGRAHGLASGLGAATAFGLTLISNTLVQQQFPLRLIGGVFLCILGVRTLGTKPSEKACRERGSDLFGAYGSTFLLTLTNPMTILSFAAIFAGVGLGSDVADYWSAALLVFSVFAGSALWWMILTGSISLLRKRITPRFLTWINRVSGVVIMAFGVLALVSIIP